MMEVGGSAAGEDAFGSAKDLTALTSLIENNISVMCAACWKSCTDRAMWLYRLREL